MSKTKKRSRRAPAPVLEPDSIPRTTITLTDESVWLTRHDRTGAPTATYPVSAAAVANAFNQFGASTGLLPADTLFWQSRSGQLRMGVYIAPGKRTINLRTGARLDQLTIPLPGLVFVGHGPRYAIFAAAQRPAREADILYHCPLPNVYEDGKICVGTVPFPACTLDTIQQSITLFFESEFNHDLAGQDLIALLKKLDGKRGFPMKALRESTTLGAMMDQRQRDVQFGTFVADHAPDYADDVDPYELAYNGPDEDEDDDDDDED